MSFIIYANPNSLSVKLYLYRIFEFSHFTKMSHNQNQNDLFISIADESNMHIKLPYDGVSVNFLNEHF